MKKENFWNDAARWGAAVGSLLIFSFILEHRLAIGERFGLYVVEWLLAVAAHYWLLHRAARRRSALYTAEEGFSFGQGYGFLLAVSGFAGFLSGVAQHVYVHFVVGYTAYFEGLMEMGRRQLAQIGASSPSMESAMSEFFAQLTSLPEPSILSTIWGGIFSSCFFALLFGVIIAGVLSRAPQLFDTRSDE